MLPKLWSLFEITILGLKTFLLMFPMVLWKIKWTGFSCIFFSPFYKMFMLTLEKYKNISWLGWLAGLSGRLAVWQAGSLAGGRFGCQAEG